MDLKDIHKHLVEELKIPEKCITSTHGGYYVHSMRYGLTPTTDYKSNILHITVEGDRIRVEPYMVYARTTSYTKLNKAFDRRINNVWSKALASEKAGLHRQKVWTTQLDALIEKYKDISNNPYVSTYFGNSYPAFALEWFGSRCEIDPEDESVLLPGIGCKVPLTAAFDFLNECEVFKLLQG